MRKPPDGPDPQLPGPRGMPRMKFGSDHCHDASAGCVGCMCSCTCEWCCPQEPEPTLREYRALVDGHEEAK